MVFLKCALRKMKYFPATDSFRSKLNYNNNLYAILGKVAERLEGSPGMTWEKLIEEKLFRPLNMSDTSCITPGYGLDDLARQYVTMDDNHVALNNTLVQ